MIDSLVTVYKASIAKVLNPFPHNYQDLYCRLANAAKKSESSGSPELRDLLEKLIYAALLAIEDSAQFEQILKEKPLPESDLDLFERLIPHVEEPLLKARLADIVWTQRRQESFGLLVLQISDSFPIEPILWFPTGETIIRRSIKIAGTLKRHPEQLESVKIKVLDAFTTAEATIIPSIQAILYENNWGDPCSVAGKLSAMASQIEQENKHPIARFYWEDARRWIIRAKMPTHEIDSKVMQSFVTEAEGCLAINKPFQAQQVARKALEALAQLPKVHQPAGLKDKLLKIIETTGLDSRAEMQQFSWTIKTNQEIFHMVKEAISGKNFEEAYSELVGLPVEPNLDDLTRQTHEFINQFPLLAIAKKMKIVEPGRQEGEAGSIMGTEAEAGRRFEQEMQGIFVIDCSQKVVDFIEPARHILHTEHPLDLEFFLQRYSKSPILPEQSVPLIARAIFHGYQGNFVDCIPQLIPQIEAIVRHLFKAEGENTFVTDSKKKGESEVNLGSLLARERAVEILGSEGVFVLKALLTDTFGTQLRHRNAHGQLTKDEMEGAASIYLWWIVLHWVESSLDGASASGSGSASGASERRR